MPRGESRQPSPETLTLEREDSASFELAWTSEETADLTTVAQEIATFRTLAQRGPLTDAQTMRFQELVETLQKRITNKEREFTFEAEHLYDKSVWDTHI